MNFQATDYLNDLNIDFENVSPNTEHTSNDLDLFSQSEFFDLDVFAKDTMAPTKQQQYAIKQEQDQDFGLLLNLEESQVSPVNLQFEQEQTIEQQSPSDPSVEDKRKRNTAASARFRIKKKMKEQQMQQKSKELQDRVIGLEKKLKTLEMENKCLKNLIVKQNEQKNSDLLENIKKRSIVDTSSTFEYTK
mmetsp:Transcript_9268/g.9173  ORF Transcript_9268/g.9173 Transcript_9268/m.9173 type:complete len:190 (+) Transcript_9268:68-637(+)